MGHYSGTEGWLHIGVKRRMKASAYQKGLDPDSGSEICNLRKDKI